MEVPAAAAASGKDHAAKDHPKDAKVLAPTGDLPAKTSSPHKSGHTLHDWDTLATVGE